ncbi:hypothetical protein D9619_010997 [Psilocybe cf. subviscida]|uniref:Nephrocystin 3-like N-terminal domain-containing protein n=1 Tax=Psilocybe cf. subviscida TaxID=2480587 RepID=A0A8H5B8I8_9AGAR|nr:hypothetical protein D9619_010997 [Psilocybe cf. subviscida]
MATFFGNANINSISGGTFQVVSESSPTDAARRLLSRHIAPNALPDSAAMYDAPKCYPETRKAINNKLQLWIRRQLDLDTKLMWLHGGAGAGKSAILRTIALGDETKGYNVGTPRVLGSFFFSRTDPTRNTALALVPTLAFQLCKAHPVAKDIVLKNIADNYELIFATSIRNQVHSLLVQPLSHLESQYNWLSNADQDQGEPGRVFIIDGLDECADSKKQVEIIEAIAILVRDVPVRVLLASRPDAPIPSTIRHSAALRGACSEISLSDDPDSEADIRLFVEQTLREVREKYHSQPFSPVSDSWPDGYDIDKLVEKSSSHFVYASTAMNYIASGDERPDVALSVILGLKTPRTGTPFEELDTLYRHILGKAKFRKELLKILSHCVFTKFSNSVESIHLVLEYTREDILHFLLDMSSLVSVVRHPHEGPVVQLRHASLGDFLRDQSRAKEFYIGTLRRFHRDHLHRYFALLDSARILPGNRAVKQLAIYSAESRDWDPLVHHIATGLAGTPVSDDVTLLIQQHPPKVIYDFVASSWEDKERGQDLQGDQGDREQEDSVRISEGLGAYIQGVHDYDVEGGGIFRECLEGFLGVQKFIEELYVNTDRDPHSFQGVIIPLLLEGVRIKRLTYIAHRLFDYGLQSRTLTAFRCAAGDNGMDFRCQHYYPVSILRQIRKRMPDADENLARATRRLLQVIIDDLDIIYDDEDEHNSVAVYRSILAVLTKILPKLVYTQEVAFYTTQRLPRLHLDLSDEYQDFLTTPRRRMRKAMKAYSMRKGDSTTDASTHSSDPNDGTNTDGGICSSGDYYDYKRGEVYECGHANEDFEI